ncbi:MAG: YdgA family protein [Legionella sp.]|nr:YdgA family protein [Legionella sp.]
MKKLAGLIIILAVLILGAYYVMGMQTERAIKKNVDLINQHKDVTAQLGPYKRGLFSSQTTIKWQLHLPARIITDAEGKPQVIPAEDIQSEMPLKVYHGPVIVTGKKVLMGMGYATAVLPIPDNYTQKFETMFTAESVKPLLNVSIFVNYLNKSTLQLDIPTFKLISKDGKIHVDWSGMNSTTSIASGVNKFNGSIDLKSVTFKQDDAIMALDTANSEFDLRKHATGLYLGNIKFYLPSFSLSEHDKKTFNIKELKANTDSDIEDNRFSSHVGLSFDSVLANDKTYGPGNMEISLRNINAEVLGRLNAMAKQMQNNPANQKNMLFTMIPEVPKLFNEGAELEVSDFEFKLPQGPVKGNLFISIAKADITNPFELLQKIKGHATLKLPKEIVKVVMHRSVLQQLAKQPDLAQTLTQQLQSNGTTTIQPVLTQEQLASLQTDKQIASLEKAGLVVSKGSDYEIDVNLEQGKFTVNGKPFDPSVPIKF